MTKRIWDGSLRMYWRIRYLTGLQACKRKQASIVRLRIRNQKTFKLRFEYIELLFYFKTKAAFANSCVLLATCALLFRRGVIYFLLIYQIQNFKMCESHCESDKKGGPRSDKR